MKRNESSETENPFMNRRTKVVHTKIEGFKLRKIMMK